MRRMFLTVSVKGSLMVQRVLL
jgi:hypothetical protein